MSNQQPKKIMVRVRAPAADYPILIGNNLDEAIVKILKKLVPRRVVIISDTSVAKLYGNQFAGRLKQAGFETLLVPFAPGERSKNQTTVTQLQSAMFQKRCGRDSVVVALGGGVVGDVAGFVAASYMRGIPYVQVPTTLLAMTDSSIGGKVGIDTEFGKNTVGAFWPPKAVFMDVQYLKKLPPSQVTMGLMEAVKTFFTSHVSGLAIAANIDVAHPDRSLALLKEVVVMSAKVKAGVVSRDEREKNERRVVNFGHTIGHVLEKLSRYSIPHGLAIANGMIAEVQIAQMLDICSPKDAGAVVRYLSRFGIKSDIFRRFSARAIVTAIYGDKKVKDGQPYYVLLKKIGGVYKKNGQFAHPVNDAVVKKVLMQLGCKK